MSRDDSTEIREVYLTGYFKKDRHYVFQVNVSWSDGTNQQLARRYADFASFHRALLARCHSNLEEVELPVLPTFQEVFHTVLDDSTYLVPDLELLTDYCMTLLATVNNLFVQGFFEYSNFDSELRRRQLSRSVANSDIYSRHVDNFPEFLVIADFVSEKFSVEAGETVFVFGGDNDGWNIVTYYAFNGIKYGWIPNNYLLLKEKDEPMVEDIQTYLLDLRSSSGNEFFVCNDTADTDLLKFGANFYKYRLTQASCVYCINGDAITLKRREVVTVVDRDVDGWWFVSCQEGEGWIPSTVLEPRRASLKNHKEDQDSILIPDEKSTDWKRPVPYYVTEDYRANQTDELSLSAGDCIQVLYQSMSGWWTVKSQCLFGDSTVGLFPGQLLSRTAKKMILTSGVGRAYNIGFNSSLANQPPPRRGSPEILSPISAPLSPPIMEGTVFTECSLSPSNSRQSSPYPALNIAQRENNESKNGTSLILNSQRHQLKQELNNDYPKSEKEQHPLHKSHIHITDRLLCRSLPASPDHSQFFLNDDHLSDGEDDDILTATRSAVPLRFLSPRSPDPSSWNRSGSPFLHTQRQSPIPIRFYKKQAFLSPQLQVRHLLLSSTGVREMKSLPPEKEAMYHSDTLCPSDVPAQSILQSHPKPPLLGDTDVEDTLIAETGQLENEVVTAKEEESLDTDETKLQDRHLFKEHQDDESDQNMSTTSKLTCGNVSYKRESSFEKIKSTVPDDVMTDDNDPTGSPELSVLSTTNVSDETQDKTFDDLPELAWKSTPLHIKSPIVPSTIDLQQQLEEQVLPPLSDKDSLDIDYSSLPKSTNHQTSFKSETQNISNLSQEVFFQHVTLDEFIESFPPNHNEEKDLVNNNRDISYQSLPSTTENFALNSTTDHTPSDHLPDNTVHDLLLFSPSDHTPHDKHTFQSASAIGCTPSAYPLDNFLDNSVPRQPVLPSSHTPLRSSGKIRQQSLSPTHLTSLKEPTCQSPSQTDQYHPLDNIQRHQSLSPSDYILSSTDKINNHQSLLSTSLIHHRSSLPTDRHHWSPLPTDQPCQSYLPFDPSQYRYSSNNTRHHSLIPSHPTSVHRQSLSPDQYPQHHRSPSSDQYRSPSPDQYPQHHRSPSSDQYRSPSPDQYPQHHRSPSSDQYRSPSPDQYPQHHRLPSSDQYRSPSPDQYPQHHRLPSSDQYRSPSPDQYPQHHQSPSSDQYRSPSPDQYPQHHRSPLPTDQHHQSPFPFDPIQYRHSNNNTRHHSLTPDPSHPTSLSEYTAHRRSSSPINNRHQSPSPTDLSLPRYNTQHHHSLFPTDATYLTDPSYHLPLSSTNHHMSFPSTVDHTYRSNRSTRHLSLSPTDHTYSLTSPTHQLSLRSHVDNPYHRSSLPQSLPDLFLQFRQKDNNKHKHEHHHESNSTT